MASFPEGGGKRKEERWRSHLNLKKGSSSWKQEHVLGHFHRPQWRKCNAAMNIINACKYNLSKHKQCTWLSYFCTSRLLDIYNINTATKQKWSKTSISINTETSSNTTQLNIWFCVKWYSVGREKFTLINKWRGHSGSIVCLNAY